MRPTPFLTSPLLRRARTAAAAVAACLIALSAAAQNPPPADQAEKRLRDIETERSRISYEAVALAEKTESATADQRAALMQQLKELQRRDTALQQEQTQLRRAGGAPLTGTPPPLPGGGIPQFPGGGAPKAPLVLPPIPDGGPQVSGGDLQVSGDGATLFSPAEAVRGANPVRPPSVTPRASEPRVPHAELSPAAKHALCGEKFAAAQSMRKEAPGIRTKIKALESKRDQLGLSVRDVNELADLEAKRDYTASQISILEESIESLGCDPATGKPKARAAKNPAVSDSRAPAFDFRGTWLLINPNGKIGKMTITHAEAPGIVDCIDADGNTASGPRTDRFIGGRIEFEPGQLPFRVLNYSMGHNQWRALVAGGPPRPAVFLGCVTGDTAEIWLHPETGNTPDCRLKIRGDANDKTRAQIDGQSLARSYTETSTYRWWGMRKQ